MPTKFSSIIGASKLHRAKRGSTRSSRNAAGKAANTVITRYVDRDGNEWRILTRQDGSSTRELCEVAR
jgi:hypothetical protein